MTMFKHLLDGALPASTDFQLLEPSHLTFKRCSMSCYESSLVSSTFVWAYN